MVYQQLKKSKYRLLDLVIKMITYILLILFSLMVALPFFWMLSTSLKDEGDVFISPPKWIPSPVRWQNYVEIFEQAHLVRGFFNTLSVIIPPIAIGLFMCSLAAYAFAKLQFPGRDKLFFILIATMMIPGAVMMIPAFILFKMFGWVDTWKPLMIPGMFGAPIVIFFLRQFMKTLPDELIDAAKIDGLNPFGIFLKIVLPLSKPALVTQAVLSFNAGYNDFLGPLIYLNSPEKYTLQLELASFSSYYSSQWTYIMAASVLALIPTLLMFIFAQRFFIEGITLTGLKR
ncbi:carbohydrate ABC transporter permease [Thermoanaerobacter mathranii]|uniref:carbohydrate ABC transporter permease n=1 Tax=Thermoanaerobacter mathranii TaxID=583357 RepID=UPI003D6A29AE